MMYHKYPKTPFIGNIIKGYAEIEKDELPYEINFVVNFSVCFPRQAKEYFIQQIVDEQEIEKIKVKEDSIIQEMRQYCSNNIFNTRKIARKMRDIISNEGFYIDPYLCFSFCYEHGCNNFKRFEYIYGPINCNIRVAVTKQYQNQLKTPRDLNNFIGEMLVKIDGMFDDIQKEHLVVTFIPREIAKLDNEQKVKTMNTINELQYV